MQFLAPVNCATIIRTFANRKNAPLRRSFFSPPRADKINNVGWAVPEESLTDNDDVQSAQTRVFFGESRSSLNSVPPSRGAKRDLLTRVCLSRAPVRSNHFALARKAVRCARQNRRPDEDD